MCDVIRQHTWFVSCLRPTPPPLPHHPRMEQQHSMQQGKEEGQRANAPPPPPQKQQQQHERARSRMGAAGATDAEKKKQQQQQQQLPPSNLGPTSSRYQLLCMECAAASETRRLLASLDVAWWLSLAALITYLVLRWQPISTPAAAGTAAMFICTPAVAAVNLAVAALLVPLAVGALAWAAHRTAGSLAAHKRWTQQRRRLFGLYAAQLAATTVGLCAYLTANALVVSPLTCADAATRRAIYWIACVRWSAWNSTFLCILIKAHCTSIVAPAAAAAAADKRWPRLLRMALEPSSREPEDAAARAGDHDQHQHQHQHQQLATAGGRAEDDHDLEAGLGPVAAPPPGGSRHASHHHQHQPPADMLVLDLPWLYHAPKLLLWGAFEACHIALAVQESLDRNDRTCRALTDTCDLRACCPSSLVVGLMAAVLALALLYYGLWAWLLLRSGRLLRSRPWQLHRVGNLMLRLERRLGFWSYTLVVVATVVFWFGGMRDCDCSRAAFQYLGLPSTELMWAAISVVGCLMMQPHNPTEANPRVLVELQEFAWVESALPARMEARNARLATRRAAAAEPMFCFETAMKQFFISAAIYSEYEGTRGLPNGGAAVGVPEQELEQLLKMLALCSLHTHKVVYDDDGELKVWLGWSDECIVVCFRGSTTASNWITDAMLWRTAHPGSEWQSNKAVHQNREKVHSGFLRCWSGTGLDRRVLSMLGSLLELSLAPDRLRIFFTGWALTGGALATLAAFDFVTKSPAGRTIDSLRQVYVYTYGAPRVGNHVFAHVYEAAVPQTWHVINAQDSVPRGGKFVSLYKRNGQRVVVNKAGDLVVRPSPLESSLLQAAFGSNPLHHLLQSYQEALTAVALGQLDELKSLPGGPDGLLSLIRACPLMADSLYRYGSAPNLLLWVGGRFWYTLVSRPPREQLTVRKLVSKHALATNDGDEPPPPAGGRAAARGASERAAAAQQRRQQHQGGGSLLQRAAGLPAQLGRLGSLALLRAGSRALSAEAGHAAAATGQPPAPLPPPALTTSAGAAPITISSCSSSGSSSDVMLSRGRPDPLEAAAGRDLARVQHKAAADRMGPRLQLPMLDELVGLVTGVRTAHHPHPQQQQPAASLPAASRPAHPAATTGARASPVAAASTAADVPQQAEGLDLEHAAASGLPQGVPSAYGLAPADARAPGLAAADTSAASLQQPAAVHSRCAQLGISAEDAAALELQQYVDPLAPAGGVAAALLALLRPAHSAPLALFNPAAVLTGQQGGGGPDSSGIMGSLLSKVAGAAAGGSSSSSGHGGGGDGAAAVAGVAGAAAGAAGELAQGAAAAATGALGQVGLASPAAAAAGTTADASSEGPSSSGGRVLHALLRPFHRRSASSSSSGGGSTHHGADPEAPADRRYLVSLGVTRLSLRSGLAGGEEVALSTQVHMPVLQEEGA